MSINTYLRQDGRKGIWMTLLSAVEFGHKFAVYARKNGERVVKYPSSNGYRQCQYCAR